MLENVQEISKRQRKCFLGALKREKKQTDMSSLEQKKRSGAVVKGRIKDEKMLAREKKCFNKAKSEPKQKKTE